jgi:hypothetical protein
MTLTKELLETAMETSHDPCKGPEGCIHAEAVADARKTVRKHVAGTAQSGLAIDGDPIMGAWYGGLHVGYRLAMLELQSAPKDKVN